MNTGIRQIGMGLILGLFTVFTTGDLNAQILKGVKKATSSVTKPLKDVQKSTKSVTKPIQDTRKDIQTIKKAPKDVTNEVKRTKSEFDRAGSDIEKAGGDIKKVTDGRGSKKEKDKQAAVDSSQTTTQTETVVVDERRDRAEVGANKRQPRTSNNETISPVSAPAPKRRLPATAKTNTPPTSSGNRSVYLKPTNSSPTNATKVKPDYSKSPARYALEHADFDSETLQELFDNAVWDGPGRDHTMRSISFHLKQLKADLNEIKKIDPAAKVSHHDRKYKEWYAEYTRREREGQATGNH